MAGLKTQPTVKTTEAVLPKNLQLSSLNGDGNIAKLKEILIEFKSSENSKTKGEITNNKDILDQKVSYKADSVEFNKSKSIIYMFGNAKVAYDDVNLSGSKIIYDAGRGLFKATNAIIYHHSKNVKADSIYYDLRTSKAKLFGADLDR